MKILVTGSEGFIGSNLVKILKEDGHKVIGWDIKNGYDVCDSSLRLRGLDEIYHLACPVNPGNYEEVAVNTILASSSGTYNMLELARKNKAKFLYVSSSEIYGEKYYRPYQESDLVILDPYSLRLFYDSSKLIGEALTLAYYRYNGVDVRIIRPFNIYGPGMRKNDTRVIPSFMRKIKAGEPVQIAGDGNATRTFCYIDDFLDGVVKAMRFPKTTGEIFNLGTTHLVTIKKLAKLMNAEIEYIPTRLSEQRNRKPNVKKANRILDWYPQVSLEEGIKLIWEKYL
jgi:nucleoside-diphosphate-sugar epimerase